MQHARHSKVILAVIGIFMGIGLMCLFLSRADADCDPTGACPGGGGGHHDDTPTCDPTTTDCTSCFDTNGNQIDCPPPPPPGECDPNAQDCEPQACFNDSGNEIDCDTGCILGAGGNCPPPPTDECDPAVEDCGEVCDPAVEDCGEVCDPAVEDCGEVCDPAVEDCGEVCDPAVEDCGEVCDPAVEDCGEVCDPAVEDCGEVCDPAVEDCGTDKDEPRCVDCLTITNSVPPLYTAAPDQPQSSSSTKIYPPSLVETGPETPIILAFSMLGSLTYMRLRPLKKQ